jgi:hypothetical protein
MGIRGLVVWFNRLVLKLKQGRKNRLNAFKTRFSREKSGLCGGHLPYLF